MARKDESAAPEARILREAESPRSARYNAPVRDRPTLDSGGSVGIHTAPRPGAGPLLAILPFLLGGCEDRAGLGATKIQGNMAMWLDTPVVRPGDEVRIAVAVMGDLRVGIESVVIRDGDARLFRAEGGGRDWGSFLTVSKAGLRTTDEVDRAALEIEFVAPSNWEWGETRELVLDLHYIEAVERSFVEFESKRKTNSCPFAIEVVSPLALVFRRIYVWAVPWVAIVLATLGFWLGWDRIARTLTRLSWRSAILGCVGRFAAFAIYAGVGIFLFHRPLDLEFPRAGPLLAVLTLPGWLLLPPLLGIVVLPRR